MSNQDSESVIVEHRRFKFSMKTFVRLTVLTLLVTGIILIFALKLNNKIPEILSYAKQNSNSIEAVLVYFTVFLVISISGIPISIVSVGGGYIFGYYALLIVFVCIVICGTLGFLLARKLLRTTLTKRLKAAGYEKLLIVLNSATEHDGWKIGFLLRLSQVVPFAIGNYILSLTRLPFHVFIISTTVGVYPGLACFTYLGCFLTNIDQIDGVKLEFMVPIYVGCILITLVWLSCISRRAWRRALVKIQQENVDTDDKSLLEESNPNPVDELELGFTRVEKIWMISSAVLGVSGIVVALIIQYFPK